MSWPHILTSSVDASEPPNKHKIHHLQPRDLCYRFAICENPTSDPLVETKLSTIDHPDPRNLNHAPTEEPSRSWHWTSSKLVPKHRMISRAARRSEQAPHSISTRYLESHTAAEWVWKSRIERQNVMDMYFLTNCQLFPPVVLKGHHRRQE